MRTHATCLMEEAAGMRGLVNDERLEARLGARALNRVSDIDVDFWC